MYFKFQVGVAALLILQASIPVWADNGDDFQFFQEEAKVAIATQREQTPEEAPSIVSVITQADIQRYGARNLSDILRNVPGFEFTAEIYSIEALNFRGIASDEGKSLLMINGIAQNELGFGGYNFMGSIPAAMIEKVEIIRGPGSAVYGGFAETDVINVITRQPEDLSGMRVSGEVGTLGHDAYTRFGDVSFASKTDNLRVAVDVGYGASLVSTRDYADFYGNRLSLNQDTAYENWRHIITEASSKNLTLSYQRTSYTWGGQDTFTTIQPAVNGNNLEDVNNYNDVTHLDYKAKLSDHLTLQPLFEYTRNNTYSLVNPASIAAEFEGSGTSMWRYRGEMSVLYDSPWSAQIRLGGGYIQDGVDSVASDGTPGLQLSADPNDVGNRATSSSSYGLFEYAQQIHSIGVTVGGRYEDTTFGNAFAPRAGLTYVHDAFNAKLLYGRAYRIPLPFEVYSRQEIFNGNLKPETADTTEMELGYKFTPHVTGKFNVFFINIDNPIVFEGNTDSYANFGRDQSEGAETELRADYLHVGGFANVAYATPGPDTSPIFRTQSKKQFLAAPPIKITLGTYYKAGMMEYAPSLNFLSQRAGQSSASANDPSQTLLSTTEYPALVLANMNIIAHDVLKSLDVHLAVHNIFNTNYMLIQADYADHAPLPTQGREIDLGVTWHI